MKRQRFLSLIVAVMAGVLLVVCSGCVRKEKKPDSEELVINVYDSASDYVGEQGGWYGRILAEKFHIRLNFLDPADEEALREADLIVYRQEEATSPAEAEDLIKSLMEENLFLDMEPYLEEREIWEYEDQLRYWNEALSENGIYVIPTNISRMAVETPGEEEIPLYGIYLQWEAYAQAGYPRIKDREELLKVLADMKSGLEPDRTGEAVAEEAATPEAAAGEAVEGEAAAEETAAEETVESATREAAAEESEGRGNGADKTGSDDTPKEKVGIALYREPGDDILEQLARMIGAYGYETCGFAMYRQNPLMDVGILDEDLLLIKGNPLMRAMHWLWEANQAGLLDEESRVQDREAVLRKYESGLVLAHAEPSLNINGYELAPVEDVEAVSHGCNPKGTLSTFVAVNSGTRNPDRILDFISWLYSAEGIMDSGTHTAGKTAGPMGLTWEVSGGMPVLTEFGAAVTGGTDRELPEGWGEGTWEEGRCRLGLQPVTTVETSPSGFLYNYTLWESFRHREDPVYEDWCVQMEAGDAMEYLIKNGNLSVISAYVAPEGAEYEDTREIRELRQPLKAMIEESLWNILDAPDEEGYGRMWEEMVQKAEQMGYEKVLEFDLEKVDKLRKAREEAAR